jgi:hypothetical protein
MAELRMRIFSNRDKEQTLEELEEQVNEFLASVYQVERILQSGGDYFATITVCYWDRPSAGPGTDASLAELEKELSGASLPGGSAGSGETLSHTHELAAQGVRGLALEEGGLEHAGLDTTDDNLRHSNVEAQFRFADSGPSDSAEDNAGDLIAQSLAEELDDELGDATVAATPMESPELTWEHACELHRLEDGMLTALEKLTAFRAAHPLAGPELIDFLLGEESLVQMVEQVRAASEELGSTMRAHALRNGFNPLQPSGSEGQAELVGAASTSSGADVGTTRDLETDRAAAARQLSLLQGQLAEISRRIDEFSRKKNFYVARLKQAIEAQDAAQQESSRQALESLQRILSSLRKRLRSTKDKVSETSED